MWGGKRDPQFEEVEKFNPYHGSDGRFTSAGGAASFTYKPGASKAHDNAIAREKKKAVSSGGAGGSSSTKSTTPKAQKSPKPREFKVGDIVRFDPKWCAPGERGLLHVVKEQHLHPVKNTLTRYRIQTINSKDTVFQPSWEVDDYMIKHTGFNVSDFKASDQTREAITRAVEHQEKKKKAAKEKREEFERNLKNYNELIR